MTAVGKSATTALQEVGKMIVDKMENAHLYSGVSARMARGFELLKDSQLPEKADGRYEVDGSSLFYLVQSYASHPAEERRFESHQKYIDIQYMLLGEEVMGYAPASTLVLKTPYDEAKDIAFYDTPGSYSRLEVREGMFALFYPEDGHMPGCQLSGPSNVRKVVVKVLVGAG